MASSRRISEAGASSPTALPTRWALALLLVNTTAMRFSALGVRAGAKVAALVEMDFITQLAPLPLVVV
jgi:hypothetical protein